MAHKSIALTTELKELAVTHSMPQPAATELRKACPTEYVRTASVR